MSFQDTAPYFHTFCGSDQSLLPLNQNFWLLNRKCTSQRPAHIWFLKIALSTKSIYVYVCVSVCVRVCMHIFPRLYIGN